MLVHAKACLSCRQRKLKCDRQKPCVNCVTRSLECRQQSLPPSARSRRGVRQPRQAAQATQVTSGSATSLDSILARLDRVEAYIHEAQSNSSGNHGHSDPSRNHQMELANGTVFSAPRTCADVPAPNTLRVPCVLQPVKASTSDSVLRRVLTTDLVVCVSPSSDAPPRATHQIKLPPKPEVLQMFQVYQDYVGPFQHIVYEPHALQLIDIIYDQVGCSSPQAEGEVPRGLALVLAFVAVGIILAPLPEDPVNPDNPGSHPPRGGSLVLIKDRLERAGVAIGAAMDCLDHDRRRSSSQPHLVENLQAMLVLQFLIMHIEAFSPRYRALLTEAVAASHSLGLHRLDATTTTTTAMAVSKRAMESPAMAYDPITREMMRRVWWYLTATDWIISMAQGPLDAIYLVQPKLIVSNLPLHINDEDLEHGSSSRGEGGTLTERPWTEPTDMSYVLHRLRIAEVARSLSDDLPLSSFPSNTGVLTQAVSLHSRNTTTAVPAVVTCTHIVGLDARLEAVVQSLPPFFRVETADSPGTDRVDRMHPHIPMQRLLLHLNVNILRCKLHYPYLTGGGTPASSSSSSSRVDPALHAFSRKAGLQAARRVLAAHREMHRSSSRRNRDNRSTTILEHAADYMKIQGMVFHMFMGALVLAADLCCNQGEHGQRQQLPEDDERSRQLEELMEAIGQLEGIQQHSQVAAQFLAHLKQLLIQYGVWSPEAEQPPGLSQPLTAPWTMPEPEVAPGNDNQSDDLAGLDGLLPFDDLWAMFVQRPSGLDMADLLSMEVAM